MHPLTTRTVAGPSFRFTRGRLYLFGPFGDVIVIRSWPELRAVRKDEDDREWTAFEPAFRLVRPYRRDRPRRPAPEAAPAQLDLGLGVKTAAPRPTRAQLRKRAFDGFRFSLPKEMARCTERFGSRQWRMLQLFRARAQAVELAGQSPALAFCLANGDLFASGRHAPPIATAAAWSRRRQREILGLLGYEDREGVARIVARILPEAVHARSMLRLRAALPDPAVARLLAHLPAIHAGVLGLVSDVELLPAVTPKLLAEVAARDDEKYRGTTARMLADVRAMARQIGSGDVPPAFFTIDRLREVHRKLSEEFCRLRPDDVRSIRFPQPPLPGTPDILPLRTPTDLMDEGREQANCVASYIPRVRDRETYIYRVLRPQRATLAIVPSVDGGWEVDQLLLGRNARAGRPTWARVEAWLAEYSLSA
jgi:hypothetical protein